MATLNVLLCEDNPADVDLVHESLTRGDRVTLHHVADGEKALKFLRREPPYSDAPRPSVILMDLNLPRHDGLSVLEHVRATPELANIPVIMISTSDAAQDVDRSYELGANCYITKPMGFGEFQRVMQLVESFWLQTVKLPQ